MNRRMVKLSSLAMAVLLLASAFSISALAYSDDYATIELPKEFIVEEYANMEEHGYINIYGEEIYVEDGKEYYTYNDIDIYVETPELFNKNGIYEYYNKDETLDIVKGYVEDGNGTVVDAKYKETTINGIETMLYEVNYQWDGADESGARVVYDCFYSAVMYLSNGYLVTIYIDVSSDTQDLVGERDRLLNIAYTSIKLNAETAEVIAGQNNSYIITALAIVLGGLVVGIIITVIIVVVVVKASKKKQKAPVYPYNPNQQYYNPNAPYGNGMPQQPAEPPMMQNTQPSDEVPAENNSENLDN